MVTAIGSNGLAAIDTDETVDAVAVAKVRGRVLALIKSCVYDCLCYHRHLGGKCNAMYQKDHQRLGLGGRQ